jgi:hypothetical protein
LVAFSFSAAGILSRRIQRLTVRRTFDETLGELRVAQAFFELMFPKAIPGQMIPIVLLGNYEIKSALIVFNGFVAQANRAISFLAMSEFRLRGNMGGC